MADNSKDTVTLSKAELADIKKFMEESVAKDKEIADLKGMVGVLRKSVEEQGGKALPGTSEQEEVKSGQFGHMRQTPEGKWVLGWTARGAYRETSKTNPLEMVEYIDLIIEGEEEPRKTLYLDFLNNYHRKVVRLKERRTLPPDVKDEGMVPYMPYDMKAGEHVHSGRMVRSKVVSERYEFDVELDGKIVAVHERFINQ